VIPFPKDLKGASGSDVGVKAVVVRLGTRQGYYVVATRYGQLDRELWYEELSVSKTPLVDIPSLMEVYSSQSPRQIVSLKRVSELVNGSSSNSKSQACKCTKKGCWLPSAQFGGMSKRSSCPCRQAGRLCGSGCHLQQSARSGCGCRNKDTQANVRSQATSATPVVHASEQASTHSNPFATPVQSPRAEPTTSGRTQHCPSVCAVGMAGQLGWGCRLEWPNTTVHIHLSVPSRDWTLGCTIGRSGWPSDMPAGRTQHCPSVCAVGLAGQLGWGCRL
jgi:hypothetical protein